MVPALHQWWVEIILSYFPVHSLSKLRSLCLEPQGVLLMEKKLHRCQQWRYFRSVITYEPTPQMVVKVQGPMQKRRLCEVSPSSLDNCNSHQVPSCSMNGGVLNISWCSMHVTMAFLTSLSFSFPNQGTSCRPGWGANICSKALQTRAECPVSFGSVT